MRWAAAVEYDGSAYCGWQSQAQDPTVQAHVEHALGRVADEPIPVIACGRTDAGVHAAEQIIHFDSRADRAPAAWLLGSNRYLPADIAPQWFAPVADDFHARYQAYARDYRYAILDRPAPTALWRDRAWHVRHRLDDNAMRAAATALVGEHDFSAFRAASCQAYSAKRCVHHIDIRRSGNWLAIDVRANAFLHHMVRNIVGSLVQVGRGYHQPEWVVEVLDSGDRRRAGPTAPAQGLVFVRAHYPAETGVPALQARYAAFRGTPDMGLEC